jgi:hypothetical protein
MYLVINSSYALKLKWSEIALAISTLATAKAVALLFFGYQLKAGHFYG